MVTVTPGITPPEASWIVPEIVPVWAGCAEAAAAAAASSTASIRHRTTLLSMFLSSGTSARRKLRRVGRADLEGSEGEPLHHVPKSQQPPARLAALSAGS